MAATDLTNLLQSQARQKGRQAQSKSSAQKDADEEITEMTIGEPEDDYNPPPPEDDEEDENGEPLAPPAIQKLASRSLGVGAPEKLGGNVKPKRETGSPRP